MPAYLVAKVEITNRAGFEPYGTAVGAPPTSAAVCAAHAIESAGSRPTRAGRGSRPLLRRLQGERYRPRILAGRHARQLHPAQKRDGQSEHAAPGLGEITCIRL
jgi:hypothetical protein